MSQGLDMTVNSLPSRTWNWLKMNESKLKEIEAGDTWASFLERRISYEDLGTGFKSSLLFLYAPSV